MNHFMFLGTMDDGLLIEQVSAFSFLYNKRETLFKNKIARESAWKTIGEIMEQSPSDCEQRWTVLRAKYTGLRRQLKTIPSGSEAVKESWPHFEALGFLDSFLSTRKTTSNFTTTSTTAEAWNTVRYILNSDKYGEESSNMDSQLEDSHENIDLNQTLCDETTPASAIPSTSTANSQPQLSTQRGEIPLKSNRKPTAQEAMGEGLGSSFSSRPQSYTPTVIPRKSMPKLNKKQTAQESLCEKLGSCFECLSTKLTSSDNKESEDINFAKSLVTDMLLLTPAEKVVFKSKIYAMLAEIIEERKNN